MKIVLAGGTGFIGQYLQEKFGKEGNQVLVVSRQKEHIPWSETELQTSLDNADILINLAGKSVNCRYTQANKKAILESRTQTTALLQKVIDQCEQPPKLWINSSTATLYRHAEDHPMDELNGEIGSGFSVEVGKAWEAAFFKEESPKTRKIALRISIVLGKNGGVIPEFTRLVKMGMGGAHGSGKQYFSWIHIEDVFQMIQFFVAHPETNGIYNAASPNPLRNKDFMRTYRSILKPIIAIPLPKLLLEFGAKLIGTETELLLKSRWVIPTRALQAGFTFTYPNVEDALKNILNK